MEVGEIEDCNCCIIFIYQLVVVVVVVYVNGVWMTTVHSAGSWPRHMPKDLLITHGIKKTPFTRWLEKH